MFLDSSQGLLWLLIHNDANTVSKHRSQQARFESPYKAHISFSLENLSSTGHKTLIVEQSTPLIGIFGAKLDASFDDILGVGEKFAAEGSEWSHTKSLHYIEMLLLLPHEMVLEELVCGELKPIWRYFPDSSWKDSFVNTLKTTLTINCP